MADSRNLINMACRLCRSAFLHDLGVIGIRPGSVTSDSKVCALSATVLYCPACGLFQKAHDEEARKVIENVYVDYAAHHLSDGSEQLVFVPGYEPLTRTSYALKQCAKFLKSSGVMLDFGAGKGAMLISAADILDGWIFDAYDLNECNCSDIQGIKGYRTFISGTLSNIPKEQYDLITLWHVLEHVSDPVELIRVLKNALTRGGMLLAQVPDVERTPFDMAVIDHYTHFSRSTFKRLFSQAGYAIVFDGYDLSHNCLTILAAPAENINTDCQLHTENSEELVNWINGVCSDFCVAVGEESYAIFGTGMASLWISTQLPREPYAFFDEDQRKTGKFIGNAPVLTPEQIIGSGPVLFPFSPYFAQSLLQRLQREYIAWTIVKAFAAGENLY